MIDTFLEARDYTPNFVGHSVFIMMEKDIEGRTEMDFRGVSVMDRDLETLAELIIDYDLEVVGLDKDTKVLLDSYVRRLNEPVFDNLEDFRNMFLSKFPPGTLCIWDKSLMKNVPSIETVLSLVMPEKIEGNYVYFRLYNSHLMEPKHVYAHGGLDSPELYKMEAIHVSDFVGKEVIFRYPKDEKETQIFELLKGI